MNPLIKNLAEQCGFTFNDYNEPTQRKVELLSELIVRECAAINYKSPFKDGEFHAREVLENFGVEE
jgi:hypothetical protein